MLEKIFNLFMYFVCAVLILSSILVFRAAYYEYMPASDLIANSKIMEGKVVDFEERQTTTGSRPRRIITYAPIVEYEVNGLKVNFTSALSTSSKNYEIGEIVKVRYNDDSAEIDSFIRLWAKVLILGGIGSFLLFSGLFGIIFKKKILRIFINSRK